MSLKNETPKTKDELLEEEFKSGKAIPVLDKGYVRLINSYGTDLDVVNAARASFAKESESLSDKDERLIAFLAREGHWAVFRHCFVTLEVKAPLEIARQWWKYCYSADTEVLTEDGWKFWPNVLIEDKLANVTKDGKFYYAKPKELISYDYHGDMIRFENSKTDLFMTPNHRVYASKRIKRTSEYEDFSLYRADDLMKGEYRLPKLPTFEMEKGDDKDYALGLHYGFSLAEGNFSASKNRVYFIVKKERERKTIEFLREQLPFLDWRDHIAEKGFIKVSSEKPSVSYSGTLLEKRIDFSYLPKTINSYTGFLDGYYLGDGSTNQYGVRQVCSISEELIKDIALICTHLGKPTSYFGLSPDRDSYGNRTVFHLTIGQNKHRHLAEMNRTRVPYSGLVYCAEVDTGLLLVRRNGKVSVCGNCTGSAQTDSFSTAWSEMSKRYVTSGLEFYVPEADQWRSAPANMKQGSAEPLNPEIGAGLTTNLLRLLDDTQAAYHEALALGVAPEVARLFLMGYGMYVSWRWSTSLQGLAFFLNQRLEEGAQSEIQEYASGVLTLTKDKWPVSMEALVNDGLE